ncbi:MAG: UDP-N-acetylmuramoyl-L-alanine--D-glutamate ligase [Burkholderiaceae bacterium]|nr:UDP-N-acetylmuramoyl-L-alanine--D-glutamate ligase [Burkholderiaceae bacterium]
MRHLQDLNVMVLGLGESGLAMAAWCARFGARVQVWDSRENPPQAAALAEKVPAATRLSGEFAENVLHGVQLLLKSPGLAPGDARIAPLLAQARAAGIRIQGELDLFAQALADLKAERRYAPAVLAITGTNGKTTTTSMTAQLVARTGKRVAMAGNIGPTMLDTLAVALDLEPVAEVEPSAEPVVAEESTEAEERALEAPAEVEAEPEPIPEQTTLEAVDALLDEPPLPIKPPPPKAPVFEYLPEVWVLELSSFQLDGVQGFEPTAGTVLNITQDHLDWHGGMEAYIAAKARVFGEQGVMVINRDDPRVEALVPAPVMVKGGRGRPTRAVSRKLVRFGLDAPDRPGDFGLVTENGMAWLVRALEADETIKRRKDDDEEEIIIQRLMPADALRVRGRHNASNALAALALCSTAGLPLAPMLHGLREYRGEPHRVEHVNTIDGIDAIDDSKGTNVGATVAALTGLGQDRTPSRIVIILGGDGKGQDFSPLAAPVARHARAVALIGRDAAQIEAVLAETGVPQQRFDDLPAATQWAFEQAQSGDCVLLSPACASLDMFRNYAHRAEVFVDAVQALASERGMA